MREATAIKGPFSHLLNPKFLRLPFDDVYEAISVATEKPSDTAEYYGVVLWTELARRNADLVALDQTIDRLPPIAFGKAGTSVAFTVMLREWATYKAPDVGAGFFVFKHKLLEAGWKPSQVNVHLVIGLRMEEMMLGEIYMSDSQPDFDTLDINELTERERDVFQHIRSNPAHA